MKTGVKATDDRRDVVVIPSDQVQVAPSDAEITNLLRAAARQHSDTGVNAADVSASAPVPMVDTKFRASAVNDDVQASGPTLGRRMMRGFAALLLALGIGAAAVSWQTFGYAAKKVLISWAPKWAIAASLPLDKLGLGSNSSQSDNPDEAAPAHADASTPAATDASAQANTAVNAGPAAPLPDATQQLQSMSRDLASANQEIATLKASIAELKAGQQQMARDLAKAASDRTAELAAKAKAAAARKLATTTAASPPATTYRPNPSTYSAQAAAPLPPPQVTAQPYVPPPPMQIQPQADPGLPPTALRPPMPVQ